jgi:hypothetical protein
MHSRRSVLSLAAVPLSVVLLAVSVADAKDEPDARDLFLPDGYPELTKEHKRLTEVPFAKGAPAVVLLEAQQIEWDENLIFRRIHYYQRIKILEEAGIDRWGDYELALWGDWRVKKVEARTVLPDGTVVDAEDSIFREESEETGRQQIRVEYPQVSEGAILDLHMEYTTNPWFVRPWEVQRFIPVLESRFVLIPPQGLRFRTHVQGFPPELNSPLKGRFKRSHGYVYRFQDVEPLEPEPYMPNVSDVTKALIVIVEHFRNASSFLGIASDWEMYSGLMHDGWERWLEKSSDDAEALAKKVAGELQDPVAKAEAIRRALRERIRMELVWRGWLHDSPDEVLEKGYGYSGDIAGTAVAMLRAVDVEAHLALIRRRTEGTIPREVPIPALLNDMLVKIETDQGPVHFSPVSDMEVGLLPWDCTGVLAVPVEEDVTEPVLIPDMPAERNRIVTETKAQLKPDGTLVADTTLTYHGAAAELMRRKLRNLAADERRLRMQRRLGEHLEEIDLQTLEIEHLSDFVEPLELTCHWVGPRYARKAGDRLLVNPNLFARVDSQNWASPERQFAIDFERAYDRIDKLVLDLPDAATKIQPPGQADLNAGAVGYYKAQVEAGADELTFERHMRLNLYRLPASSYSGLRKWFGAIASADERMAVISLQ